MMRLKVAILAGLMLLTGSVNTIATKYQDITVVGTDKSGRLRTFQHPAFQSGCMFLGEFACLFAYLLSLLFRKPKQPEREGLPPTLRQAPWGTKLKALLAFSIPAICDSGATTLLNIGLFYTYASVFQMLRGTLVIFAGLLTILMLKRKLHIHHWLGIVLITAGAALVGASSVIFSDKSPAHNAPGIPSHPHRAWYKGRHLMIMEGGNGGAESAAAPLFGDILVVVAQLAAATQFIIEEKYLTKYRVPALLAVGLEGFWGLIICAIALPILSAVPGSDGAVFDSFPTAVQEIRASRALQWSTLGSVVSIAFFNFFGISVTKNLSGAARCTIDACRTLFIWMFSLWIGWEKFHGLEVLGFIVIVSGSGLYNELLRTCLPKFASGEEVESQLTEPLVGVSGQTAPLPPLPPGGRTAPHEARPRSIMGPKYTMSRSVRLFPTALSPHSLASPALNYGFGSERSQALADSEQESTAPD